MVYDDPLHCHLNKENPTNNLTNVNTTNSEISSVPSEINMSEDVDINNCKANINNKAAVPLRTMQRIQHKISRQKMIIMRILEAQHSKEALDKQIAVSI